MVLAGLDVATNTGIAICRGDDIFASSYRAAGRRPDDLEKGEVDPIFEGQVAARMRDHLHSLFVSEKVECCAIEQPLRSDLTRKIRTPAGIIEKPMVTFSALYRIYVLNGVANEICARLNIPLYWAHQASWRKAFLGSRTKPKGNDDEKWWKKQSRAQCELLGIKCTNDDMAEAVGVVWWLRGELTREKQLELVK